jgi:uncharacterized protein
MVWMLICVPLSAVVMGVVLITLAIRSADGLVADDYYKRGKEINRVLDRDRYTREAGIRAQLNMDPSKQTVNVSLHSDNPVLENQTITLRLLHPTRAGYDLELVLSRTPDGGYFGLLSPLLHSEWIIQLETEKWRLNKRLYIGDAPISSELGSTSS